MQPKTMSRRPKSVLPAPLIDWTLDTQESDVRDSERPADPLAELGLHPLPPKSQRLRIDPPGSLAGFI